MYQKCGWIKRGWIKLWVDKVGDGKLVWRECLIIKGVMYAMVGGVFVALERGVMSCVW